MKAKLAYFCSSESWGGLEMNHLRNAAWMQERGHSVVVLCVQGSPIDKSALDFNLPVTHISKQKKYYDFKQGKYLVEIIKRNDISHLIIRSTGDMSILAYAKSKLKSAIHTSYFMEMQLGVKKTNPLHTLRFKYIDLWSCPLNWLKTQVDEMTKFNNELVVIPSAMDVSQFNNLPSKTESRTALDLPDDTTIFGLIGRFDQQKGQLLLLEAMRLTKRDNYSIALLGEPTLHEGQDYFNEMKKVIEQPEFKKRVHLRSYRKDTETFYNAVDWLVMATKAETFGMVTIESLATGTPVLGSNAGGTPEILENEKGGKLFTSLDAQDLALKIDEILDKQESYDPIELKQMAQQYDHHSVCTAVEMALGISSN
ncbi:MAG: glycosyltransferase family 4 protein [Crocinitomicaceae bacterium]|nr:glycosyltransferase family 4 protein [Crocinitomicaceae bacterium]